MSACALTISSCERSAGCNYKSKKLKLLQYGFSVLQPSSTNYLKMEVRSLGFKGATGRGECGVPAKRIGSGPVETTLRIIQRIRV